MTSNPLVAPFPEYKLYTGYFARVGKLPQAYAITVVKPQWFNGHHFPMLAPTNTMLHLYKRGKINQTEYTHMYLELLKVRGVTPAIVANRLQTGAILTCYEGPKQFCHRHIAATWLQAGGIQVEEWTL